MNAPTFLDFIPYTDEGKSSFQEVSHKNGWDLYVLNKLEIICVT